MAVASAITLGFKYISFSLRGLVRILREDESGRCKEDNRGARKIPQIARGK